VLLGARRRAPFERPSAEVIAELVVGDRLTYTICRIGDGYVARLPWIADFFINAGLDHLVCHPVPSVRPDFDPLKLIPIIIPGTVTAFLLSMRGWCVLHGSAVDLGGHAVAFVGPSGQGKSTMAAVFCAAGAKLVTDDVLPIAFEGTASSSPFCVRSGHEIRLREKAASLAEYFGSQSTRITSDERRAVAPETTSAERVLLSAVVLPRPDRERSHVGARRLQPGEALLALSRCERIEGWRGAEHYRRQFDDLGRVVASAAVFEISVPWGPPFPATVAQEVLDACGLEIVPFPLASSNPI
jgi:hypothetical protein